VIVTIEGDKEALCELLIELKNLKKLLKGERVLCHQVVGYDVLFTAEDGDQLRDSENHHRKNN
jgi:hypothetical protein